MKTPAEDGFPVRHDELDLSPRDLGTKTEYKELLSKTDTITVGSRALEHDFTIPEHKRAMVCEFRDTHEKDFSGSDGAQCWTARDKSIVFAATKCHTAALAKRFDEQSANLTPHPASWYADFVVSDVGRGPARDGSTIVDCFKEEDHSRY